MEDARPQSEQAGPQVVVRRSARRRRSVSARRDGARILVDIPDHFSPAEETEWVAKLVGRLRAKEQAGRLSDDDLHARAEGLARRYLGGAPQPASVRWVTNQSGRWGSCTPAKRTIRISHRLRRAPDWVLDYVLVHELAHLLEAGHTAHFWALVSNYPHTDRAQAYLEGVTAAAWLESEEEGPPPEPEL